MRRVTVQVDGRPMTAWRNSGPGPPVVCVHGAGVSSREFQPFVDAPGMRHDTWSVDLPGFGASRGPRRPLGLPELADALAHWLTACGLDRAVLLGGSFGCQVAVEAALRHPERVAGLVLVGPTVDPAARSFARQLLRWIRNSPHERPSMAPLNLADYRDAGVRHVIGAFVASLRDRIETKLPYVTVPALVVRGAEDRLVPQEWAEEATRLLPAGRLAVVSGSGHMVPHRRPDELAELVSAFLARERADPEESGSRGTGTRR